MHKPIRPPMLAEKQVAAKKNCSKCFILTYKVVDSIEGISFELHDELVLEEDVHHGGLGPDNARHAQMYRHAMMNENTLTSGIQSQVPSHCHGSPFE